MCRQAGPARVLLGSYGVHRGNRVPLADQLSSGTPEAGERWRYEPRRTMSSSGRPLVGSLVDCLTNCGMAISRRSSRRASWSNSKHRPTRVRSRLGRSAQHNLVPGYYLSTRRPSASRWRGAHFVNQSASLKEAVCNACSSPPGTLGAIANGPNGATRAAVEGTAGSPRSGRSWHQAPSPHDRTAPAFLFNPTTIPLINSECVAAIALAGCLAAPGSKSDRSIQSERAPSSIGDLFGSLVSHINMRQLSDGRYEVFFRA